MVPGMQAASAGRWLGEEEWEGNARRPGGEKVPRALLQAARPRLRTAWIAVIGAGALRYVPCVSCVWSILPV